MRSLQLLLQAKADITIQSTVSVIVVRVYHLLLADIIILQRGFTALHKACEKGHIEIVKHLIKAGCNQAIDVQTRVSGVWHGCT